MGSETCKRYLCHLPSRSAGGWDARSVVRSCSESVSQLLSLPWNLLGPVARGYKPLLSFIVSFLLLLVNLFIANKYLLSPTTLEVKCEAPYKFLVTFITFDFIILVVLCQGTATCQEPAWHLVCFRLFHRHHRAGSLPHLIDESRLRRIKWLCGS